MEAAVFDISKINLLNIDNTKLPDLSGMAVSKVDISEEREAKRQAWLEEKRGRMSASEIGIFFTQKLELSKNAGIETYLYRKAAERLGSQRLDVKAASLDWGKEHEVAAIELHMETTGKKIINYGDDQEFIRSGNIGATPDGIEPQSDQLCIILKEVKCPIEPAFHLKHREVKTQEQFKELALKDSKVKNYYCQMQHQILVAGKAGFEVLGVDFISYDPRYIDTENEQLALHVIRIKKDPEFIRKLQVALEQAEEKIKEIIKKVR